jgi:hypothetical protein
MAATWSPTDPISLHQLQGKSESASTNVWKQYSDDKNGDSL